MRGKAQAQPDFWPSSSPVPACRPIIPCGPSSAVWMPASRNSPPPRRALREGRSPSFQPKQLLKTRFLTALHCVRRQRLFCEQLGYHRLRFDDRGAAPDLGPPTVARRDVGENCGADMAYHRNDFVTACREQAIAPPVAGKDGVNVPSLDGRTTTKESYRVSQRIRKRWRKSLSRSKRWADCGAAGIG